MPTRNENGMGLDNYREFADFIVFNQETYISFLRILGVEDGRKSPGFVDVCDL